MLLQINISFTKGSGEDVTRIVREVALSPEFDQSGLGFNIVSDVSELLDG